MSGYVLPCNLPNFQQSAPRGDEWEFVDEGNPHRAGQVTWRNTETGKMIICPAIWYTFPAGRYAETLRWYAERNDETARGKEAESDPWSPRQAMDSRHQARRLRAMALLCDQNPHVAAGSIDFRGLSNPSIPKETEIAIISEIEKESANL